MSDIAKNFEKLAVAIERDRRKLDLFALFRREGQRQWEIVLSSDWAIQHKRDAIWYVGAKAAELLNKDEAAEVGSIIIVDSAAGVLWQRFGAPGKYHGFTLNDVPVSEAIIVRLGARRELFYPPRGLFGLIVMSYFGKISERSNRALYGSISFFDRRTFVA